MDNTREINLGEMGKVNGGYVVNDEANNKYWIVRQDGSVIAPAPSVEKAQEFAKEFQTSPTVMTMEEYKKHFGRELVW
jgi:hypothetical protein